LVRVLVSTFGFDIDFAARRLREGFDRVILLALGAGDVSRVEKAYHTLASFCEALRITCELKVVAPGSIVRDVIAILTGVLGDSGVESVEVYLTGGPRVLVVATLIATLMLPLGLLDKIVVRVEGEGFDYTATLDTTVLAKLLSLEDPERRIMHALVKHGPLSLSDVAAKTGLPRTTTFNKLNKLMKLELVEKRDEKYYASEEATSVFNI